MGDFVDLTKARRAQVAETEATRRAKEYAEIRAEILRGEGCPWSEDELVEAWWSHARRVWRPHRGIKRGCIRQLMRRAYVQSDQGTDWLKCFPGDLICEALPASWGEENLDAAAYVTVLLYDYLWRIAAIDDDEKAFCFGWTRKSQAHILDVARRHGCIPRLPPLRRGDK